LPTPGTGDIVTWNGGFAQQKLKKQKTEKGKRKKKVGESDPADKS
jgi:hypothetical protein